MRAHVLGFGSPDLEHGSTVPADPDDAAVLVELEVAEEGVSGADLFGVTVCTPTWLARRVREGGPLHLRHRLVVARFAWQNSCDVVQRMFESEEADTWDDLVLELGRHGAWEFEDYRAEPPAAAPAVVPVRGRVASFELLDLPPGTDVPVDPHDAAVTVDVSVEREEGPDAAVFRLVVCTTGWLDRHVRQNGPLDGMHHLAVDEFDRDVVGDAIRTEFEDPTADTWEQLVIKLDRIGSVKNSTG